MNKNILILKKNGKYIEGNESDVRKYWNKSKFILIPITEYDINGFIPVAPDLLRVDLSEMEHADIDVKLGYLYHEYETDFEDIVKCKKTSFETNSIAELINLIHSIDKISYFNDILYDPYLSDTTSIDIIVLYMRVTIYSDKQVIFNNSYRYSNESNEYMSMISLFSDIYISFPITKKLYTLIFDMHDHLWENSSSVSSQIDRVNINLKYFEHECYGIYCASSNTVCILDANIIHDIANVYNISFQSFMDFTVDISELKDILEFFHYYNYYIINLHLLRIYIPQYVNLKNRSINTFYIMDKEYGDFDRSLQLNYERDEIGINVLADCIHALHNFDNEKEDDKK